jgi:hypothetical protein
MEGRMKNREGDKTGGKEERQTNGKNERMKRRE